MSVFNYSILFSSLLISLPLLGREPTSHPWATHQREAYLDGDWEHFFGAAQAYRQYVWSEHPSVHLVSLEILALIKFCRYAEAEQLISVLEQGVSSHSIKTSEKTIQNLKWIKSLLTSLHRIPIPSTIKTSPSLEHLNSHSREVLWRWNPLWSQGQGAPLSAGDPPRPEERGLPLFDEPTLVHHDVSPSHFSMKVESRCN